MTNPTQRPAANAPGDAATALPPFGHGCSHAYARVCALRVRACAASCVPCASLPLPLGSPQADVDLIVTEMELDKETAERKLREHKGDVVQTLNTLVSA